MHRLIECRYLPQALVTSAENCYNAPAIQWDLDWMNFGGPKIDWKATFFAGEPNGSLYSSVFRILNLCTFKWSVIGIIYLSSLALPCRFFSAALCIGVQGYLKTCSLCPSSTVYCLYCNAFLLLTALCSESHQRQTSLLSRKPNLTHYFCLEQWPCGESSMSAL